MVRSGGRTGNWEEGELTNERTNGVIVRMRVCLHPARHMVCEEREQRAERERCLEETGRSTGGSARGLELIAQNKTRYTRRAIGF